MMRVLAGLGAILGVLVFYSVMLGVALAVLDPRGLDWSQFVPDTISGLFTGAVVAVIVGVILSQRESDERRKNSSNRAWFTWQAMRSEVSANMPHAFSLRHFRMNEFFEQFRPMLDLVETKDAAGLMDAAIDEAQRGVLGELFAVISNGHHILRVGKEFELALTVALLQEGVDFDKREHFSEVALGLALGNEEIEIASMSGLTQIDQYTPTARAALYRCRDEADSFTSTAREYKRSWDSLRTAARG